MSNRILLGAGTVLAAVVAALWYTAAAPSSGRQVDPGGDAVVVSAVQAGGGSWIRYSVTVANAGDRDYEGSILLRNGGPEGVRGSPGQVADLTAPARSGRFPSVAPDAAYQVHIRVPARKQRVISITSADRYTVVEAADLRGLTLARSQVEAAISSPVAVLSDNGAAADAISKVVAGDFPIRVLDLGGPRTFPSSAAQLSGFAEVVIDRADTAALSRTQVAALRDFVGLGGALVVAGGSDWRRTFAGLPSDLLPLRGLSGASADLAPVASLTGLTGDFTAPVVAGTLAPGARLVAGAADHPLVVESGLGAGRVVLLAFDPAAEPVSSSRLAAPAWSAAVTRVLSKAPGSPPGTSALPGPNPLPGPLFRPPIDPPLPSPLAVGMVLVAYLLVVGPVNLLLARRLRKPDLLWITTPLIAITATGSFWAGGMAIQGGDRDDVVQVLKRGSEGTVAALEFHRVLFHSRGDHRLELPAGSVVAPLTLALYLSTSSEECARCGLQLSGLPQHVEEHVFNSVPPTVSESGVAYGNVRMISSLSIQRQPGGVEAHLSARGGQVTGTVRNLGSSSLRQLALYSFDGEVLHRTLLSSELGPGRVQEVAGRPVPAETAEGASRVPGQPGPELQLANSLARNAMNWDTRPVLIASVESPRAGSLLIDGKPGSRAARGFLEQPVQIESADSLRRDFAQVRLAFGGTDPRGGALNVYDLELPPGSPGSLVLAVEKSRGASLEVYGWDDAVWRKGSWGDDPGDPSRLLVPVTPGELAGGLLRLRVREARTSWGTFISILDKPAGGLPAV